MKCVSESAEPSFSHLSFKNESAIPPPKFFPWQDAQFFSYNSSTFTSANTLLENAPRDRAISDNPPVIIFVVVCDNGGTFIFPYSYRFNNSGYTGKSTSVRCLLVLSLQPYLLPEHVLNQKNGYPFIKRLPSRLPKMVLKSSHQRR